MVEPPPVLVPPRPAPRPTLKTAFGTSVILVLLLLTLTNIVSLPVVAVWAVRTFSTGGFYGPVATVRTHKGLSEADLKGLTDAVAKQLPGSKVTTVTDGGRTVIEVRSPTGHTDPVRVQASVSRAIVETNVEPWLVDPVAPDLVTPDPAGILKDPLILVGSALSLQASILLLYLLGRRVYFKGDRAFPSFHVGPLWRPVLIGALLGVPVALVSNNLDTFLRHLWHVPLTSVWDATAHFGFWGKAGIVLAGVIGAPIFEEVFFRGMLIGLFQKLDRPWVGVAVSSVVFGVAHLQDAPTVVTIAVMGAVLGAVYVKTRSLYATIAIHMVNNAVSFWMLWTQ